MSAAEVIELIKKLPPEEQAEVRKFVLRAEPSSGVRYASDEDFNAVTDKVFADNRDLLRRLAQ